MFCDFIASSEMHRKLTKCFNKRFEYIFCVQDLLRESQMMRAFTELSLVNMVPSVNHEKNHGCESLTPTISLTLAVEIGYPVPI